MSLQSLKTVLINYSKNCLITKYLSKAKFSVIFFPVYFDDSMQCLVFQQQKRSRGQKDNIFFSITSKTVTFDYVENPERGKIVGCDIFLRMDSFPPFFGNSNRLTRDFAHPKDRKASPDNVTRE